MFKWVCLGVAAGFLAVFLWMVNDLRLQVRATAERVRTVSDRVTEDLPPLVERTRETTGVLSASLPKVVERVNRSTEVVAANLPKTIEQVSRTTEVVAELAEDIRQLKELLGVQATVRDKSLVAYANNALTLVEQVRRDDRHEKGGGQGAEGHAARRRVGGVGTEGGVLPGATRPVAQGAAAQPDTDKARHRVDDRATGQGAAAAARLAQGERPGDAEDRVGRPPVAAFDDDDDGGSRERQSPGSSHAGERP
ncbi:MAG: hypothetical protein U0736_21200 [Gemmataceae bacterium]